MIRDVIDEIINYRWVIVIYCIIIVLFCAILWALTTRFSWKTKGIVPFALMYDLSKKQAIEFALLMGRACFVLTSAIVCRNINVGYLVILCLFSLAIFILNRDLKGLFINLLNSLAVFVLLYVQSSLLNYYQTIESLTIIFVMLIMIGVFCVLYSLLQLLNAYEGILNANN